jgi:hypothetical protein
VGPRARSIPYTSAFPGHDMTPSSVRVASNIRGRGPDFMGWPLGSDPKLDDIRSSVQSSSAPLHWLSGAEPTLRADLPELIEQLSPLSTIGLDTDGLALHSATVTNGLVHRGLQRVRIGLHSSQSDAHDWLVGLPGAARRARRAIRTCVEAGLEVHGQIVISRPTTEHLPETIALLFRLGVRGIHLRRPYLSHSLDDRALSISPRLGLLEPWLEAAVQEAAARPLVIHDIPPCIAPRLHISMFQPEPWVLPEGVSRLSPESGRGCPTCPGTGLCPGAPPDYVAHFGRNELDSAGVLARDPTRRPTVPLEVASPPPPRAGRPPATRLRHLHRQLDLGALHGDPMNGQNGQQPSKSITISLRGSSRSIRKEMVRAAQEGSSDLILRAPGSNPHPQLAELLQDSGRLGFERVTLCASRAQLDSLGERRTVALRKIHHVEEI